jgi:hypothetical protein
MNCHHSNDAEQLQVILKIVLQVLIARDVLNNFTNTGTCMQLLIGNIFKETQAFPVEVWFLSSYSTTNVEIHYSG